MERFAEKLKNARKAAGLSQAELAERIGVTQRSFTDYECGRAVPRQARIERIADELGISVLYLINDAIDDPAFGGKVEAEMRKSGDLCGESDVVEMTELLQRNTAFLAGGQVSQDVKDKFFEALMVAYITCKKESARAAQS